MKTIEIKSQGSREFMATFSDGVVGRLRYLKWYSLEAVITIGESTYTIVPKGFWKSRYEISKGNKLLLTVANTWSGYEITKPNDLERPFTMMPKGFFKSGYTIKNHKQEVLLEVDSDFSWKKFTQDYKVNLDSVLGDEEQDRMLAFLSVYFYVASQAAAAGAA